MRKLAILFPLLFLLGACATMGVPAPQTFQERALAATATVNTASQTVLTLLKARKITPDESDRYTDRTENAQNAIRLASSIYASDPLAAENRLEQTIALLQILTAELEQRQ